MNSIWYSLAWKEWHEHKWKLVSMVAILCGVATFPLASKEFSGSTIALLSLCVLFLAMFIGLGAAANERSRNTLPFLQSLPVPLWRVAVMKIVFGLLSLFAAIILAIAFVALWNEFAGRDTRWWVRQMATDHVAQLWYIDGFRLALFATGMFAWSAAAGVNRRDEVSAGAMAVVAMVGWGLFFAIGTLVIHRWIIDIDLPANQEKWKWLAVVAFSTLPGGTFLGHDLSEKAPHIPLAFTYVTAGVVYFLLLASYVFRFHCVRLFENGFRKTAEPVSTRAEWLSGPRRTPVSAILWMQARESAPVAIAGFLASTGVTLVAAIGHGLSRQQVDAGFLADVYSNTAIVVGFFVALVTGIGVCLNDVSPNINQFWRSRPIQPDVWFWVKFATGIAVVIVSIYGPILLLGGIGLPVFRTMDYPNRYLIPMMQVAVFAAAVATICLVRHAVYAAILSIVVVYLGTLLGIAICFVPDWLQSRPVDFFSDPGPLRVAIGLALSFIMSSLLAWLAMRNDWGPTSR